MEPNDNANTMNLFMTPECLGEALQDYLHKIEVLHKARDIVSMSIPIEVDEEGNIPMILELSTLNKSGMN